MVVSDNSSPIPMVLLDAASTGLSSIIVYHWSLWDALRCCRADINVRCKVLHLSFLLSTALTIMCTGLILFAPHADCCGIFRSTEIVPWPGNVCRYGMDWIWATPPHRILQPWAIVQCSWKAQMMLDKSHNYVNRHSTVFEEVLFKFSHEYPNPLLLGMPPVCWFQGNSKTKNPCVIRL